MDIVESIAADNPSAAARFVAGLRATEELLLAMPGIGTARDYGIEVVLVLYGPRDLETLFAP